MAESSVVWTHEKHICESDELNIIKAVRQDPKQFGKLYMLYVEQVFRYLYSRTRNVPDAEDITSQTFLSAFESFDRFRQDGHFASWLFAIARNKAMDHFRQRKNTSSIINEIEEIAVENDPLYQVIQSEETAVLSKLIQVLPEKDRELLRLRYLAAMSFPEIAHFLHRNEDAIKKYFYRLLARLQSQSEVSNE